MAKPKPYKPPVSQLLALGDLREGNEFGQPPDKWLDYHASGLSEADADELVRLATDSRREPVQYATLSARGDEDGPPRAGSTDRCHGMVKA